jgi:hypothetical protein
VRSPTEEIRLVSLRSLRGANFWSSRPVTRIDVAVGAYEEVSSAEAAGLTESLLAALPGLIEHRCSIGERGGFLTRLRRGTYAPHIIEHVGLELQVAIGHDVGYGRARGGDRAGEYTIVFEHRHAEVGLRAAALALELVQHAFAGTLESADHAISELEALAGTPDVPPLHQHVLCGVTGGADRAAVRGELLRRGLGADPIVVDLAPAYILNAGLPYATSELAIILDAEPLDVPVRYREAEQARQLVSVVADGLPRGGLVIVPAREWELQDVICEARRRVAVFSVGAEITPGDAKRAHAAAFVRGARIVLERQGSEVDGGEIHGNAPIAAQVAAALGAFLAGEASRPAGDDTRGASG